MKNMQVSKVESYNRIHDFNGANHTLLDTIDGYPDEVIKFEASLVNVNEAADNQEIETTGTVKDAKIAKKKMADVTVGYGLQGAVKAKSLGNNDLADNLWHFSDYIYRATKIEAVNRADKIRNFLNDNLGSLTNITAANITEIDDTITAYKALEEKPQDIIKGVRKSEGTEALPPAFKITDDCVDNMYALIYGKFIISNPNLVREFKNLKRLDELGVHHTGLTVFVTDAQIPEGGEPTPLEKIKVKIVEVDRTAMSDIKGVATIAVFKAGTYHVEFSGTGWVTKNLILTFTRGHILQLEVEMDKES